MCFNLYSELLLAGAQKILSWGGIDEMQLRHVGVLLPFEQQTWWSAMSISVTPLAKRQSFIVRFVRREVAFRVKSLIIHKNKARKTSITCHDQLVRRHLFSLLLAERKSHRHVCIYCIAQRPNSNGLRDLWIVDLLDWTIIGVLEVYFILVSYLSHIHWVLPKIP